MVSNKRINQLQGKYKFMENEEKLEDNPFWLKDKLMTTADKVNRKKKILDKSIDDKKAFESWKHKTSVQEALIKLDLLK